MGLMSEKMVADYQGTPIVVEGGLSAGYGIHFRLYVAGARVDDASFSLFGGQSSMRAKFVAGGGERLLELQIKQGLFGTKYRLLIDGEEHPLQKAA